MKNFTFYFKSLPVNDLIYTSFHPSNLESFNSTFCGVLYHFFNSISQTHELRVRRYLNSITFYGVFNLMPLANLKPLYGCNV